MKKENKAVNAKIGKLNYEDLPFKRFRDIGKIPIQDEYELMSGKKVGIAILWIPKMLFFCKICCAIILFSLSIIFWSIFNKPSPTLFVNYQDGTLLCSANPLSPATGQPIEREQQKYKSLCDNLNNFNKEDN